MRFTRRKAGMAGVLLALLFALPFAVAGQAHALPLPPQGTGQVYNGDSPRCLDSGTANGALLFTCSTSIYQQWVYTNADTIVGNSPTGCLDDGAGQNGSRVFLATCNGSLSQRWIPNGGVLINGASGKCLDADLNTIGGQGTIVQVWSCSGGLNQIWRFEYTP
jgi:hypothetical protein